MDNHKMNFELTGPSQEPDQLSSKNKVAEGAGEVHLPDGELPGSQTSKAAPVTPPVAANSTPQPLETPLPPSQPSSEPSSAAALPLPPAPPDEEKGDIDLQDLMHKAKVIIERTKDNPYMQSRELHEFKAKFMKEQFNKDITTSGT